MLQDVKVVVGCLAEPSGKPARHREPGPGQQRVRVMPTQPRSPLRYELLPMVRGVAETVGILVAHGEVLPDDLGQHVVLAKRPDRVA